MRRLPLSRGIYLLPNLCTTGSLFCGFYSVVRALAGDYIHAAWAIFFAAFFDMLDGRIARMTHSESDFGVEYDSLVDLASFGLAPGILMYRWSLGDFHRIGWLACFLYFACGALRLARYNVQIESIEKKRFQGLPIPIAALALASLVILQQGGYLPLGWKGGVSLALTFGLAPLMISQIRYRSFKELDLRSRQGFKALVVSVGVILIMAMNPELMPSILLMIYILSGPVEEVIGRLRRGDKRIWRRRQPQKMAILSGGQEEQK